MELRQGITGFDFPNELCDLRAFRTCCHVAARTAGARLLEIKEPSIGCNYALARFVFSDSAVVALLNEVYPVLAFANCPLEWEVLFAYVDSPNLAEVFATYGQYTVVSSEELNCALTLDMCKDLSPSELKRVRYFRPQRVGDVIFNYWD
jgi:hypothetical protein